MKTVTIRELHARTGEVVRAAAHHGEIRVTDRGLTIARIVPERPRHETPYFARRKLSPAFKRLDESGKTALGTDSTVAISEDRENRV
jgi:prevent-host-death family protein